MEIHVAYAMSQDWLRYSGISALSVLKNSNPNDEYFLYFVSNGFSDDDKNLIYRLKKVRDVNLNFLLVDDEYFDGAIHDWLGVSALYRLRLPSLISQKKVLYLDSDIIALEDISSLFQKDVSDYYLAAVKDKNSDYMAQRIGLNSTFYNSGMQLINLEKMREDNIEERYMKKLRKMDIYTDQDVMNALCVNKILSLRLKYNIMGNGYLDSEEEFKVAIKSPVLYHFILKPWNYDTDIYYYDKWCEYNKMFENLG